MRHRLRRPDGAVMLVDADLWLCLLDAALRAGWRPLGTKYPNTTLQRTALQSTAWDPLTYSLPCGQSIDAKDARELARCASHTLMDVAGEEIPLRGKAFGHENTVRLIHLAAAREEIPRAGTEAALEILSGSPKKEAEALIRFLQRGHVTIDPEDTPGTRRTP